MPGTHLSDEPYFLVIIPLRKETVKRGRLEKDLLSLMEAVESMKIGVTITDLEGRITYCNSAEAEMHGYTVQELMNNEACRLGPPSSTKKLTMDEIKSMTNWRRERENIRKDGSPLSVQLMSNVVLDDKGEPVSIVTNCEDIIERKLIEEKLLHSEQRFRSLVNSTDDSIYVVDKACRYLYMNQKHRLRMGFSSFSEFLHQPYGEFHSKEDLREFEKVVARVFSDGGSLQHEYQEADDQYFMRTLSPVKAVDGSIFAVTVVSTEITKLKLMEKQLRELSLTDELTGLYNRRGFDTLVKQELKMARRLEKGIYLLYADLDNLKAINDRFGHKEGDLAIIASANVLNKTFRDSDIIARIGGDEFVVIPIISDGSNIEKIAARLDQNLKQASLSSARNYTLSMSIGMAYFDPKKPRPIEDLLVEADKSMYEQKRKKRIAREESSP